LKGGGNTASSFSEDFSIAYNGERNACTKKGKTSMDGKEKTTHKLSLEVYFMSDLHRTCNPWKESREGKHPDTHPKVRAPHFRKKDQIDSKHVLKKGHLFLFG